MRDDALPGKHCATCKCLLPLPEDAPPALVCSWCNGTIDRQKDPFRFPRTSQAWRCRCRPDSVLPKGEGWN
jgi:hypothetical protein